MSSRQLLACKYCGAKRFKSTRGLQQHVNRTRQCAAMASSEFAPSRAVHLAAIAQDYVHVPNTPPAHGVAEMVHLQPGQGLMAGEGPAIRNLFGSLNILAAQPPNDAASVDESEEGETHFQMEVYHPQMGDPGDFGAVPDDCDASEVTCGSYYELNGPTGLAKFHLQRFHNYVANAQNNVTPFTKQEVMAIKLLDALRRKKATMDTYEAVLKVFFTHSGMIREHQGVGDAVDYVSRSKMMRKLAIRYNMYPQKCIEQELEQKRRGLRKIKQPPLYLVKPMTLPFSKSRVDVIHFDFREQLVSLLTDPRFTDDDFFHFDNDPLALPPYEEAIIGDIWTGEAYRETCKKLLTKPGKQMIVPIIMYIDGTATGQVVALKVEALKFTIGNLTRDARGKKHAWRTLGYVPSYLKEISRGKKIFQETGHESTCFHPLDDEEEGDKLLAGPGVSAIAKAQDWQAILSEMLETYRQVEENGFVFDYRFGGKTYKNLELVPFLLFVKADTEEADKLCGKFLSRTGGVKQLCRYCDLPNELTDSCVARFKLKAETKIKRLCQKNEVEKLRQMSQHCMDYAFHGMRFGLHNDRGIHGATPIDMLHMVLLGIFKYVKVEFFEQLGPGSIAAVEINALCTWIGKLFARQSDRDMPKTQFGQGIVKGKLMGKEMSGVILLLATCLQTSKGKEYLTMGRGSAFKSSVVYDDWVMLLETLLQWESYMKQETMMRKHVIRLEKKHRYLLYLIKKVIKREQGMGMKLVKFHALLHIAADILMFGVPLNVDTSSNEEHWKPTKVAAKLTQKDYRNFDRQTATRLVEFDLLDLAIDELKGNTMWDYLEREGAPVETDEDETQPDGRRKDRIYTKGTQIEVLVDEDSGANTWQFVNSRAENQHTRRWDDDVVGYLAYLQEDIFESKLLIFTEHHRNGQIFRAHPNYRQLGPWNDWVLVNWGHGGKSPAQIWCFLDLRGLEDKFRRKVDGVTVQKGVYAVVESTAYEAAAPESDLFVPCVKEATRLNEDGTMAKRKFYLAEVEAFMEPVTVVPDMGHANKLRYLQVKPRKEWAAVFVEWLEAPHKLDEMDEEYDASSSEEED